MIRPLRFRSSLLVAALLVAACGDVTGAPAASVAGVEISHERLETDAALYRFLTGLSGAPCGTPIEGESPGAACTRFALASDIREELVKVYATENGIVVAAGAVRDAIGQLEQNLGGAAELDARLSEEGLTRLDLDLLANRLLLYNEAQGAIVEEGLDEEALLDVYEESMPQFTTLEVHHILLDERQAADDLASMVTVDNFARLARTRSTDPGSASSGGNLGSFSESQFRTTFDPTFVDAALSLDPGEISGVVETQFGFHLIYLAQRDVAAFDDVRDQLAAQQGETVFRDWVLQRLSSVEVDVNPRYGRLDRDTGDVVPVRSTEEDPAGATAASGPSGSTP